ncbi:glycosyltransferase family 2 protein [Planktomarina temperata]|nr:glycosyltransferase family 2 protein [Planktomarina temperata]
MKIVENWRSQRLEPKPKFITVILNYNNEEFTDICLDALRKIDYCNHEIIVIDDFSKTNKISAIVNKYPGVILRRNEKNLVYCKSFNRGIDIALSRGADYVFLVNNDTKDFTRNYFDAVLEEFNRDVGIGIVGSRCYDYSGRVLRDESGSVRFGFNMVVPSEGYVISKLALQAVHGFNEHLIIYMEDLDLLKRLSAKGFKFGFSSACSFKHYCGATSSKFKFKFVFLRTRNICLFVRHYRSKQTRDQQLLEIRSNVGSSVKMALSYLKKGNVLDAIKMLCAVSCGLVVGYLSDLNKFFESE